MAESSAARRSTDTANAAPTEIRGPREALLAYVDAFSARNADLVSDLVGEESLVELPLLKPNRLFGKHEIRAGHAAAFQAIAAAKFELSDPAEKGPFAIAEGKLTARRANGVIDEHPLGLVVEARDGWLRRITLYIDARRYRLWSDKTIL